MNTLDLDQLRQRWQQAHDDVEPQLKLDVAALRRTIQQRSQRAFARHSTWLLLGLICHVAVFAALMTFLLSHLDDSIYRFLAAPMAGLALWQVVVSVTQWWSLRRLDLSAPVAQVRSVLDRLRGRQLLVTRWIILSSVLLWLPLMLVLLKGLFGVDLIWHLHPSVLWINALVGVVFLLLGDLLLRWIAYRWRGTAGLRRLLVETAGYSWQRAEQAFDSQIDFEQSLQSGDSAQVVAQHRRRADLTQALAAPLRRLKTRLVLTAFFYGSLMLLTGTFNASHGGDAYFLLAGLGLHFFWLAQMVAAIVHRHRLARIDYALGAEALRNRLLELDQTQHRVAQISLWFSPLLLVSVAQVFGKVVMQTNLLGALPPSGLIATLAIGVVACITLSRSLAQPTIARLADWRLLGSGRVASQLRERVVADAHSSDSKAG